MSRYCSAPRHGFAVSGDMVMRYSKLIAAGLVDFRERYDVREEAAGGGSLRSPICRA